MGEESVKHTERQECRTCTGERYVPHYLPRPDGYLDRVWTKCGSCHGKGYTEYTWSDTPFLDCMTKPYDPNASPFKPQ